MYTVQHINVVSRGLASRAPAKKKTRTFLFESTSAGKRVVNVSEQIAIRFNGFRYIYIYNTHKIIITAIFNVYVYTVDIPTHQVGVQQ